MSEGEAPPKLEVVSGTGEEPITPPKGKLKSVDGDAPELIVPEGETDEVTPPAVPPTEGDDHTPPSPAEATPVDTTPPAPTPGAGESTPPPPAAEVKPPKPEVARTAEITAADRRSDLALASQYVVLHEAHNPSPDVDNSTPAREYLTLMGNLASQGPGEFSSPLRFKPPESGANQAEIRRPDGTMWRIRNITGVNEDGSYACNMVSSADGALKPEAVNVPREQVINAMTAAEWDLIKGEFSGKAQTVIETEIAVRNGNTDILTDKTLDTEIGEVLENSGIITRADIITHLNNAYTKKGEDVPEDLLKLLEGGNIVTQEDIITLFQAEGCDTERFSEMMEKSNENIMQLTEQLEENENLKHHSRSKYERRKKELQEALDEWRAKENVYRGLVANFVSQRDVIVQRYVTQLHQGEIPPEQAMQVAVLLRGADINAIEDAIHIKGLVDEEVADEIANRIHTEKVAATKKGIMYGGLGLGGLVLMAIATGAKESRSQPQQAA